MTFLDRLYIIQYLLLFFVITIIKFPEAFTCWSTSSSLKLVDLKLKIKSFSWSKKKKNQLPNNYKSKLIIHIHLIKTILKKEHEILILLDWLISNQKSKPLISVFIGLSEPVNQILWLELGVSTHVVFTEKENQFVISFFRYSSPKLQSLPLLYIQTRSDSLLTIIYSLLTPIKLRLLFFLFQLG